MQNQKYIAKWIGYWIKQKWKQNVGINCKNWWTHHVIVYFERKITKRTIISTINVRIIRGKCSFIAESINLNQTIISVVQTKFNTKCGCFIIIRIRKIVLSFKNQWVGKYYNTGKRKKSCFDRNWS